jgi:NTP pyrophosphatase (non-canonical NTP hydrolase)
MNNLQAETIDIVANEMYDISQEHGFHKNETIGDATKERMAIFCANLHGEVSELWEATRKDVLNKPCDKTDEMTNVEEELADIVIRAFDTAVTLGISIGTAVKKKSKYNKTRPMMHGKNC